MDNQIIVSHSRKPAVIIRREMVKIPAVMDALEPVEKAVFLASTSRPIMDYSGAELAAELNTALKWIYKDVGYRTTDESDRQYIVIRVAEILKRYYSNLTLKDFRMAFEMSITGELDDFLPRGRDGQPDRGHYQQFNAEYVCKILNAYKARRGWVMKKAFEAAPKQEQMQDVLNREEYGIEIRKECVALFLHYKYRGFFPPMTPIAEMLYYGLLSKVGLADEIVVTEYEQRIILQRAINAYARRGYIHDVNRLKEQGTGAKDLEHGSFALARHRALKRTFDWMVKEEIQITDYIKFE